jgi:lipocalin-like protein
VQQLPHCYLTRMKIKYFPLLALLWLAGFMAPAQSPSIAGTWVLTAAEKLLPDGTRVSDYGANPHGLAIFTADGYYSVHIYRADRLKFSSGDKLKGTPEEYKDVSLGMSDHFGRYTLNPVKSTISFQIDRASFPNWDGTTQVRSYELKGDELSWKVPPRPDGSIPITVLRRVR